SSTGIYHIMIRGINRATIFNDKVDKNKFIEIIAKTKEETKFELYAYCLMDNHAHFLIKEKDISISNIMKKICGKYAIWFNNRHQRVGHLFQDRFKSECVETEAYLISVAKYILNNPVKANIAKEAEGYIWSSYHEYINNKTLTDTGFLLSLFSDDQIKAKKYFIEELKKEDIEAINLTIDRVRRTDQEAKEIIDKEMKLLGIQTIEKINSEERILLVKRLKAKGLTNRQIIGITGLSRNKVVGI
ncbi:MAG: transposase, partial [Clostridia bacterium]|nr:transposase [Clostridia bacterium]